MKARTSGTVEGHSINNPKIGGSNPASNTGREKNIIDGKLIQDPPFKLPCFFNLWK